MLATLWGIEKTTALERNYFELYYRVQEGLIGVITQSMRAIAIKVEKDTFVVDTIMAAEPGDLDKELIGEFTDHVTINIPWLTPGKVESKFLVSNSPLETLWDQTKTWVFMRYEAE